MKLFNKTSTKTKIVKAKEIHKYIRTNHLKESKLNLSKTNRINKKLKISKEKMNINGNPMNKIKIFYDMNNIKNKDNNLTNKIFPKMNLHKEYKFLNLIIILLIKLLFLFCKCNQEKFVLKISVTLKIKGVENVNNITDNFLKKYYPCEIDINDSTTNLNFSGNYLNSP